MKQFLLLFTIIELMVLISGVPERCVNDGVKHPYNGDSTKFVICENHIPLAKKCPIDTTFNQNAQVCDLLDNSDSDSNSRFVIRTSRAATRPRARPVQKTQKPKGQNGGSSSSSPNKEFERKNGNQHQGQINNNNNNKPQHSNNNFGKYDNDHQNINSDNGNWLNSAFDILGNIHEQHTYNKQQQHSSSDFGGNYNDHKNINFDNGWLPNQNHGLDLDEGQYNNNNKQQHTNSDFGGSYNDHKNINSDNRWFPNQNHGLDQNHIDLNGKHGSTGHSANSCNNVAPGKHISYPGDCTKFIVCMPYGNTVVKDCGLGTHFNPQVQVCDWPQSAGCKY